MGKVIFITGGARSGKSGFGLSLAEKQGGRMVYIATAKARDPEMEERIRRHKEARGPLWESVEEPLEIAKALLSIGRRDRHHRLPDPLAVEPDGKIRRRRF